jgi:hypothetical protein
MVANRACADTAIYLIALVLSDALVIVGETKRV